MPLRPATVPSPQQQQTGVLEPIEPPDFPWLQLNNVAQSFG
jgi:hypothetical protein